MSQQSEIERPPVAHLCQIFACEAERDTGLGRFLAGGLAAGERALLLALAPGRRRGLRALRRQGVAVETDIERGALLTSAPALTRALAAADRAALIAALWEQERLALDAGFRGLRVAWTVRHLAVRLDRLAELEAALSQVLESSHTRLLCQYPRGADAFVLHEALRSHRRVILDGELYRNVFFEPPEVVLGAGGAQAELDTKLGELRSPQPGRGPRGEITYGPAEQRAAIERAGRGREELLAKLAHELRNPLGTVSNALQVLQLGDQGDEARRRALEAAERQVFHQARLVEQMLEASQLVRGEVELRREPLDLSQVVAEIVESHRQTLASAERPIELVLPGAPLPVLGDRLRLTQAVSQLLHNAIKFSAGLPASRGVTVRLTALADGRAAIAVSDHGPGIRPDLLPHVFEVFTQEAQSLDRSWGGLGMGLAIVKGLIELHGGEVRASSPPAAPAAPADTGEGAEITILLPLSAPAANGNAPITAEPAARRVLVVEDNADAAMTLGDFLTLSGYEVAIASTGREGVETARRFQPEVVLCDLGLPEMDGWEVAEALRRDPATSWARLIAVTGYGRDEDRRRSREAGFDLHLTKPVDPAELRRLLRETPRQAPHEIADQPSTEPQVHQTA